MTAPRRLLAIAALASLAALDGCRPPTLVCTNDGTPLTLGRTIDRRREGRWTLFGAKGERVATGDYSGGRMTGTWKYFRSDGGLRECSEFAADQRDGLGESFHPDGKPDSRGTWRAGKRHGPWYFWLPDGTVDEARTGYYQDDVRLAQPDPPLAGMRR